MNTPGGGLPHGCNLRNALDRAKELGLEIRHVRRTGEVRVWAPEKPARRVTFNARRKDATRALVHLIRDAERRVTA